MSHLTRIRATDYHTRIITPVRFRVNPYSAGQYGLASIRKAHAAALAETGDFAAAVQVVEQTLADQSILVPESKRVRLVDQLESYRRGEPIRE